MCLKECKRFCLFCGELRNYYKVNVFLREDVGVPFLKQV